MQWSDASVDPSLAVIVPMLNEAMNAERCVRAICAVLTEHLPRSRLFVVNDGSADTTLPILQALQAEGLPVSVQTHSTNQGYGAALLTGARAAQASGFTFGLFMDSDLTNDPALIPRFAAMVRSNQYDVVKASRYIAQGGMVGVPWYHTIITRCGNRLASRLFGLGIADCTNGFRAVRLSMLLSFTYRERGFPLILEELYLLKRAGARATEIPYVLTARKAGEGRSKFRYSFGLFYRYLKYSIQAAFV